jgi:hypothetical protein
MQQKVITVTLEPDGTSKIDLTGFTDSSCAKVMEDFRAGDRIIAERKKPSFYNQARCAGQQQQH